MANRRTTPAMITKAIDAAKSRGLPVSAIEVHSGGMVRVIIQNQPADVRDDKELSCDEIFEMRCDTNT